MGEIMDPLIVPSFEEGRRAEERGERGGLTTPSAPSKVATRHFLDGAATPPRRRGLRRNPTFLPELSNRLSRALVMVYTNE